MNDPRHVVASMLIVERASADVVCALRRQRIRSILIKGPLQQQWLEAGGPARASGDVDLLLDPGDIEAAAVVVSGMGYRLQPEVTPGVEHHAGLWSAAGRVPVELHWTLWGTETSSLWSVLSLRTEEAVIAGEVVEIPDEGARCLLIALHAAHHGAGADAPRYDLERAITVAGRSAWELACELAFAVGAERAFVAGLELLPEGVQLRADLGLQSLPLTERLALNIGPRVSGAPGFYWLSRQRGPRAKARFIVRKLVPPADFMRFKYPYARRGPGQLALMYLYRPLWMARWALPALRAWRCARVTAKRSGRPPDRD